VTPSRRLSAGKKIGFSILTTVLFLVAAEFGVRGWVYYLREPYERFDTETGTFELVPGVHRAPGADVVVNSQGFVGKELEPGGEDLWRIVALGDSNTFGDGNDVHTYPVKLESRLKGREAPGHRFEVINAGIQGLDSGQALRRLESKVLALDPDVVTIYIGWNDLMKYDPLGQVKETVVSSASRTVDSLWLVKGMRKLLFFYLRTWLNPPATGPGSRTGRFTDFDPTIFSENVIRMLHLVREQGADPVLLTLPTVVRREMTIEDVRGAGIYFPYYSSAYAVGDLVDLVASYNRAIRRIAAQEQVPVVPLDQLFEARSDYRSLFYDTMHPTKKGQEFIADELSAALEDADLLGGPLRPQ